MRGTQNIRVTPEYNYYIEGNILTSISSYWGKIRSHLTPQLQLLCKIGLNIYQLNASQRKSVPFALSSLRSPWPTWFSRRQLFNDEEEKSFAERPTPNNRH